MSKKSIVVLVMLVVVCLGGVALVTSACKEQKPKSVQIEVYHPNIEDSPIRAKTYYMKYDGEPKVFEIKIYSIKDRRYLTNEDLIKKDLNSLIVVGVRKNEVTNSTRIDIANQDEWPTEAGKYHFHINFNSFVIKDDEVDPNYYGAPAMYFELIIEEDVSKD